MMNMFSNKPFSFNVKDELAKVFVNTFSNIKLNKIQSELK